MIDRVELTEVLKKWREELHQGEALSTVALRHVLADERVSPVESWSFPNETDLNELVEAMAARAERDAAGLRGEQQYVLHFHFGKSRFADVRLTYTVFASMIAGGETVGMSEGISPQGQLARNQRHTENLASLLLKGQDTAMRAIARQSDQILADNRDLRQRLVAMEQRLLDADNARQAYMRQTEALITEQHTRELASAESEQRRAMLADLGKKLFAYGPVILNRIAGKDLLPSTVSPQLELIRSFVDNVTPDKMEAVIRALSGILSPDDLVPLFELLTPFMEERAQKSDAEVAKKLAAKPQNGVAALPQWAAPT